MAHASKAILPKDVGGPWGKRMGVSVGGNLNWALRVGAYVTGRVKSSDWLRYSLVVLNCGCHHYMVVIADTIFFSRGRYATQFVCGHSCVDDYRVPR